MTELWNFVTRNSLLLSTAHMECLHTLLQREDQSFNLPEIGKKEKWNWIMYWRLSWFFRSLNMKAEWSDFVILSDKILLRASQVVCLKIYLIDSQVFRDISKNTVNCKVLLWDFVILKPYCTSPTRLTWEQDCYVGTPSWEKSQHAHTITRYSTSVIFTTYNFSSSIPCTNMGCLFQRHCSMQNPLVQVFIFIFCISL